jgi:HSP20 family protein
MMTRWTPNREMARFSRDMNRLFNGLWAVPEAARMTDTVCGSWVPAVNILEKTDAIEITVELPGLQAKDVEVTVDDGVLSIRGERSFENADEGEKYHRFESRYGSFERRFSVPSSVDPAKIEARFKNGIMTLNLPKREESLPRTVKVNVEAN